MPDAVKLHVYDLSHGMAASMSMQFLGIQLDIVPHTGVVVYGRCAARGTLSLSLTATHNRSRLLPVRAPPTRARAGSTSSPVASSPRRRTSSPLSTTRLCTR